MLDEHWLRSRLRMALDIDSRDGVAEIVDGVWRLGDARREPVLLARSLPRLWAEPVIFDRVRVAGAGIRVIAPHSPAILGAPFPSGIAWLPLGERFMFYGGWISVITGSSGLNAEEPSPRNASAPVLSRLPLGDASRLGTWAHSMYRWSGGDLPGAVVVPGRPRRWRSRDATRRSIERKAQ